MVLTVVAGMSGIVAATVPFYPRLTLVANQPSAVEDPRASSFTLTNTGNVSLQDVGIGIRICNFRTQKRSYFVAPSPCNSSNTGVIELDQFQHHLLSQDEPWTFFLSDAILITTSSNDPIAFEEIEIIV
jgi:hypothetical protein